MPRRARLAVAALCVAPAALHAQTRMLRSPTVSRTQIAFAYANNIWTVDRAGGSARRITSFQGTTENPKFSPDGKLIAFSAQYAGNTDVYVVPAEGGEPKRLTWHPGADVVQGWTPDGKIDRLQLVARDVGAECRAALLDRAGRGRCRDADAAAARLHGQDLARRTARRVSHEQLVGRRAPQLSRRAESSDLDRRSQDLRSRDDAERHGHRSRRRAGRFAARHVAFRRRQLGADSKNTDPVWAGNDAVAFLSDRDGVANVWSYDTKSKKLAQLTNFSDYDVKALDASADGSVAVFEQAGQIHLLDTKTRKAQRRQHHGDRRLPLDDAAVA